MTDTDSKGARDVAILDGVFYGVIYGVVVRSKMTKEKVVLVYDWHDNRLLDWGMQISEEEYEKHNPPHKKISSYRNCYYKTSSGEYKALSHVNARIRPFSKEKALETLLRESKNLQVNVQKHFEAISKLV